MEFIKDYFFIGVTLTFTIRLLELALNYDRVKHVTNLVPAMEPYTTWLRVFSTLLMIIIWPLTVFNFIVEFCIAFMKGFKNDE